MKAQGFNYDEDASSLGKHVEKYIGPSGRSKETLGKQRKNSASSVGCKTTKV